MFQTMFSCTSKSKSHSHNEYGIALPDGIDRDIAISIPQSLNAIALLGDLIPNEFAPDQASIFDSDGEVPLYDDFEYSEIKTEYDSPYYIYKKKIDPKL